MKAKNIMFKSVAALLLLVVSSCSKWDDYKKYTAGGETQYTGKMDSVVTYSGNERVKLTGLLPADPKITTVKVVWNSGADSMIYNITKGTGVDTFQQIISVQEGIVNFTIQTFDNAGNRSLVVNATGTAYGPKYESGLVNRPVALAQQLADGSAELTWGSFDTTSGAKATWVSYTKSDNSKDSVWVPVSQAVTLLPGFKGGTPVVLRTQYLPAPTAIDVFYAEPTSVGVKSEITSQYIQNAGPDFTNSDGTDGRWHIPAYWTVTDDVKNQDGGLGGLDTRSDGVYLSIEAWYGAPGIPNGKIYQTVTLPAGRYQFVATTGGLSAGDGAPKYVTVAKSSSLPDIDQVSSEALAYASLDQENSDFSVTFELTSETQVSLGIQAGMPDSNGNYLKVSGVKLYALP